MNTPDNINLVALQTLVKHGVERGEDFTATPEEARKLIRDGYAKKPAKKQAPAKTK